jgi:hypothetical protein
MSAIQTRHPRDQPRRLVRRHVSSPSGSTLASSAGTRLPEFLKARRLEASSVAAVLL